MVEPLERLSPKTQRARTSSKGEPLLQPQSQSQFQPPATTPSSESATFPFDRPQTNQAHSSTIMPQPTLFAGQSLSPGPAARTRQRVKQPLPALAGSPSNPKPVKGATDARGADGGPSGSRQRGQRRLNVEQMEAGSGTDVGIGSSGQGEVVSKARPSRGAKKSVAQPEAVTPETDTNRKLEALSNIHQPATTSAKGIPGLIDLTPRLRGANPAAGPSSTPKKGRRPKHVRTKSEPVTSTVSVEGELDGRAEEMPGLEKAGVPPRRQRRARVAGDETALGRKSRSAAGEEQDGIVEGMKSLRIARRRSIEKASANATRQPVMHNGGVGQAGDDDEDEEDEDEVDEILIGTFNVGGMEMNLDSDSAPEGRRLRPEPDGKASSREGAPSRRRKSRIKASFPKPFQVDIGDEVTTGASSAGETVMPTATSSDRRSSAIAGSVGPNGRGFQTDGEVTAARYSGRAQPYGSPVAESYLSQSVPSGPVGGLLGSYGDSGEESGGGARNGSRTARTARDRDREVHVETVEDLEALEDAEQWEMPGLDERGSGLDLTWQQSLFQSPGAVLPRVGSAGGGRTPIGVSRAKREKNTGARGAKYPASDLEGQFEGGRQGHPERKQKAPKGYSSTTEDSGRPSTSAHRDSSAHRNESRDNFYPLPAIPPYREVSSYATPKKPSALGSRQKATLEDISARPSFSHHTVSAPAIPAFGQLGKKNKQVEALIGMYAGPTFHNSPSPDALPAPRLKGH